MVAFYFLTSSVDLSDNTFEEIAEAKALLRKSAGECRANLSETERAEKSLSVSCRLVDNIPIISGQKISAYWPIGEEVDCKPLIFKLQAHGATIVLPTIVGANRPLVMREFLGEDHLISAQFGTLEPNVDAPEITPSIILLPLLAFDKIGARLGYGGGFYDRTIASMQNKPILIGLAFDVQEVDFVPTSTHDMTLDMIVTETGVHKV